MAKAGPFFPPYTPQQVARASAVLEAAGAFDPTPTEMPCPGFGFVTLRIDYTRGAVGGDCQFKLEGSHQSALDSPVFGQGSAFVTGTVASGSDTVSNLQREEIEYGSTGAAIESITFGPIALRSGLELLRIPAQESGVVGTPGTLAITAYFS